MLEMAIVAGVLVTLLLLVIDFGLALSFKQDLVRSVAEGARVGAVAGANPDQARDAAEAAVLDSVSSFTSADERSNHMSIVAAELPCPEDPAIWCVEVTLTFDYKDAGRQLGPMGGFQGTMTTSAIARTNRTN